MVLVPGVVHECALKCYCRNSTVATINASVVQGSVIGPQKFMVTIADLQPIFPKNRLMKYADDSYLLIGSRNIQSVHDELSNITAWAARKNLHLNPAKTREMVVIPKTRPSLSAAPPIAGGTPVSTMNILGITIDERLSVSDQVDN